MVEMVDGIRLVKYPPYFPVVALTFSGGLLFPVVSLYIF